MRLSNYNPTGREVLFHEIREEMSKGGIYIPSSDFILTEQKEFWGTSEVKYDGSKSKLGKYKVVKVGHLCTEIKPGDTILLRTGVNPEVIELDDESYFQVMDTYIIGFERE